MDLRFESIIQAVETLSIDDLKVFLDNEINAARIESLKTTASIPRAFYLEGAPEKVFFDKLVFFKDITKNLDLSIADCKLRLNMNYEEIRKVTKILEENDTQALSLFACFLESIKDILKVLSKGSTFSNLSGEPLKQLELALDNKVEVSYQYVEEVIYSLNYEPRGNSRLYNSVFVIDGEFENYLRLKEKIHNIYREISSEGLLKIREKQKELIEERDKLYRKPIKIREQMVEWRKAAMKCFDVSYSDSKLTMNPLMITYE